MDRNVATLVVGSDLRVRSCNSAWLRLGLSGPGKVVRAPIDEVFPTTGIGAAVRHVLDSREPLEGVVIPTGRKGCERYWCATLKPLSENGSRPRDVLIQFAELEGRIVMEGEVGKIVEINEVAAQALGASTAALLGQSVWGVAPFDPGRISEPYTLALESGQPLYLGRFSFQGCAGQSVELEGALFPVDT